MNFIEAARKWFALDLSRYHLYLLPIGFIQSPGGITGVSVNPDDRKLLSYLVSLVRETQAEPDDGYHVSLEINLSFQRSSASAATAVAITNDPTAAKVQLSEQDIRQRYPWDYSALLARLKERYTDFKPNAKFYAARKPLLDDPRYVHRRYLDPLNPNSANKVYYNANVVPMFDGYYTRKDG